MSEDRYVLSGPVREICDILGLPFHRTLQITLRPADVVAVVALERDGELYLNHDTGDFRSEPATETLVFKVRT